MHLLILKVFKIHLQVSSLVLKGIKRQIVTDEIACLLAIVTHNELRYEKFFVAIEFFI